MLVTARSEEGSVGKEWRLGMSPYHKKKKKQKKYTKKVKAKHKVRNISLVTWMKENNTRKR